MEHYYTVKKWQFDEQYDFRSSKYSSLCTLECFFVTVAFLNISPDSVHFLARDDQPKPSATTLESWTKRRENLTQSSNLLALENTTRESQRSKSPKCILQCTYRSNGLGHPSCPWVHKSLSDKFPNQAQDILSILVIISRGLRYTLPLIPLSGINHHFLLSLAKAFCLASTLYLATKRERKLDKKNQILQLLYFCTVFENHPKCRIWILVFWHFPLIFVL